MIIRSPFRYPGSKSRLSICQSIISYFPKDINTYYEPFCGGGGVYFAQNPYKKRWVNDIDFDLMSVYFSLRDYPDQFIKCCRNIFCLMESTDKDLCLDNLKSEFNNQLNNSIYPALRYFFLNRVCFSGRVRKGLTYFTYPEGWNITRNNGYLERIAKYIKGTKITCGDYSLLLRDESEDVFIYLDPIYISDSTRPKTSKLYDYSFTMKDHDRLACELKKCSHKWCMSYDDHPYVREKYKDYNIYPLEWTYNISSDNRPKGKELIITNYIPDKVKTAGILNTN